MKKINTCMQQMKAFKFRIYPSKDQVNQLAQFFGAKRWLFNHYLAEQKHRFEAKEKHLTNFDINKLITQLKKTEELGWLKEIDDWCLKNASEDLSNAYSNFFNSIKGKRKGKKMEIPKFKKRGNQQSYRTRNIKITEEGLRLPKIKTHINIELDRDLTGCKIKSATITKTPSGKYFVSILTEVDIPLLPMSGREVGIDMGLKDLLILSDGTKFHHPEKLLAKAKQQLKKQQKKLSRKTKGSKNRDKQRIRVVKKYEKITSIRNDYYHNISTHLVKNYDAIYMEDLNVAGMIRNRKLSRAIHEPAWSTLSSMIEYKSDWYGKTYYRISRWTPSTKTCSCCGHKLESIGMSVREWTCPSCGTHHDRDLNAALNIKNVGQMDLYNKKLSDAIADLDISDIPVALQKMTSKIERSSDLSLVNHGSEQTTRSLVV